MRIAKRLGAFLAGLALLTGSAASARDFAGTPDAMPEERAVPIALVVNAASNQILFAREAERRFVPASLTKTMSAYVAFNLLRSGALREDQRFTVRREIFDEWRGKGSRMFLNAGQEVSVTQLLAGLMNVSANDAAVVLAREAAGSIEAWTALMNREARALGMTDSFFATPNGWPDEGRTFSSARDLARLARALVHEHPDYYRRYIGKPRFRFNAITQFNHDPLIARVRGADGIKTGFTRESGFGYLGSLERDGLRLILVLAGIDSEAARARAARYFAEWGYGAFRAQPLFKAGQTVAQIRVQDGNARQVAALAPHAIIASIPRAQSSSPRLTVEYIGPVRAPITKGQKIAQLVIAVDGIAPARVDLVAARSVGRANALDRIINAVASWLP